MEYPTIALSGDLGSGKSSVAGLLVNALGARRVSTGEAQRQIAAQRGISTLELNRLAETDPTIDEEIDSVFRSLARLAEPLVVDSRLAWHFLPDAVKVHLVVDPEVAASRVLAREGARAERYGSMSEALARIADRADSERRRFQTIYGVDIFRLSNYDLVVDTTRAGPDEVAQAVLDSLGGPPVHSGPSILLDPMRADGGGASATEEADEVARLAEDVRRHGLLRLEPVVVVYRRPTFTVVDGWRGLAAARRLGLTLVPAVLETEEGPAISGQ
ncbi:MAG: (d)CMP kinase [Acidimicrobiales bacterium]